MRASTIVLSFGSAFPRDCTPSTPAVTIATQSSSVSSSFPAAAAPRRRKRVPYNGPPAPPTLETRVMPTVFRSAPMSADPSPSIFARTAVIPRCMLMPWSASPIAESRSVRESLFCAIASANARIHRTTSSCVTVTTTSRGEGGSGRGRRLLPVSSSDPPA